MPSFEEFREEFCKHTPNARRDAYSREFWDASHTQALSDANTRAGDSANEAEKDARRKDALLKIQFCIQDDEMLPRIDEIIKVAQG